MIIYKFTTVGTDGTVHVLKVFLKDYPEKLKQDLYGKKTVGLNE